ncbi:MAG: TraR/DksA C4-type zinc finger protein [Acetivibrionales bacterium]|jgi:YteA family regulatory protein
MDTKQNNHYRHLLNQHKENHSDILDDMETLRLGENDNNDTGELSGYDNHPAEIASELYDIEHQIALKKLQKHEIREIEKAVKRIENGTYGICESCSKKIDPKRLELLPQAKLCIDCAKESDNFIADMKADKKKRRPSEEQVIHSSNLNDSARGEPFHDLMEYGSADSHQDRGGKIVQ